MQFVEFVHFTKLELTSFHLSRNGNPFLRSISFEILSTLNIIWKCSSWFWNKLISSVIYPNLCYLSNPNFCKIRLSNAETKMQPKALNALVWCKIWLFSSTGSIYSISMGDVQCITYFGTLFRIKNFVSSCPLWNNITA